MKKAILTNLFSADGIRGNTAVLTRAMEPISHAIGRWLLTQAEHPMVLVGQDPRSSSDELNCILIRGLRECRVGIVEVGVVPTAAISSLIARSGEYTGGIMISGSHAQSDENGIKIFNASGVKLNDAEEEEIAAYLVGHKPQPALTPGPIFMDTGLAHRYADDLIHEFKDQPFPSHKILLDCANGAASQVAPQIYQALGLNAIPIHASPNGKNINRLSGSEYMRLNPARIARQLRMWEIPYALALDGDADRAVFVDHSGHFYDGDTLLAILALQFQTHRRFANKKNQVVITSMSNSGLKKYLDDMGLLAKEVPNGDKFITQAMLQEDLILGGEQIGHLILRTAPDRFTGDGIRTGLSILSGLAQSGALSLSQLAPGFHKWPQINVLIALKERVVVPKENIPGLPEVIAQIQTHWPDIAVRSCRPASTEPGFRIMLEARFTDVNTLAACAKILAACIQKYFRCEKKPVIILDMTHGGTIRVDHGTAGLSGA